MRRWVELLVAEALFNPVRISVDLLGAANADGSQRAGGHDRQAF
jgi:hypothetical protein